MSKPMLDMQFEAAEGHQSMFEKLAITGAIKHVFLKLMNQ